MGDKEKGEVVMASRLQKIGFGYHLTAYLSICSVLLWINFDISPQYVWAQWPLIGWGMGLVFHGLSVVVSSKKINKGFIYHLTAYILINALLVFINFTTYNTYIWFKFPLIAWTFIIVFHFWHFYSRRDARVALPPCSPAYRRPFSD